MASSLNEAESAASAATDSNEQTMNEDEIETLEQNATEEKIAAVAAAHNPFLNLSLMKMQQIPNSLLDLTFLQYFYLGFNHLHSLPDSLFSCLPNLKWLDLRCNRLEELPTVDLDCHQFLQYILLEDNCIERLPIELGFVQSLRGLSVSGNPLEFPHAEIVAEGISELQRYLREVHEGRLEIEERMKIQVIDDNREAITNDFQSTETACEQQVMAEGNEKLQMKSSNNNSKPVRELKSRDSAGSQRLASGEPLAARAQMARLHKPQVPANTQIRQQHMQRPSGIKKSSTPSSSSSKPVTQSEKHKLLVNAYPEPPPLSRIERRAVEDQRQAKRKQTLNRQEAVLQRRRDLEAARQWKEEAKVMQLRKARQQMLKGESEIQGESAARIGAAPFNAAWQPELLQLPNSHELQQQRFQGEVPPEPRPQPLTQTELRELELLRRRKEAEIAQQIHLHTEAMMQRRRHNANLTAAEHVQAAKHDVHFALQMQRELAQRKAELNNGILTLSSNAAAATMANRQFE